MEEADARRKKVRELRRTVRVQSEGNSLVASHCPHNIERSCSDRTGQSAAKQRKRTVKCHYTSEACSNLLDQDECSEEASFVYDDAPATPPQVDSNDELNISQYATILAASNNGVFFWGERMVLLADLNTKDYTLQENSYRVIINVEELLCSCDQNKMDLSLSMQKVGVEHNADAISSPLCHHIRAFKKFDIDLPPWEEQLTEAEVMHTGYGTLVVFNDLSFGTVTIVGSRLTCDCNKHNAPCPYITIVKNKLKDEQLSDELCDIQSSLETEREKIPIMQQVSASWLPIPFTSKVTQQEHENGLHLVPQKCRSCESENLVLSPSMAVPLYGRNELMMCQVSSGYCNSCGTTTEADGREQACLNMMNYVVTHDCLRDYLKLFISEGFPVYCFVKQLAWRYTESGRSDLRGYTYNRVRLAWLSFLKLLDLGSPIEDGFKCVECGEAPSVVVCDGVTLSFQRRFAVTQAPTRKSNQLDGSRFEMRTFFTMASFRKQVREFLATKSTEGIEKLIDQAQWYCPEILPILREAAHRGEILPNCWRLMRQLSKDKSVIGMLIPTEEVLAALERLATEEYDMVIAKALQKDFPILYNIFKTFVGGNESLTLIRPVVKLMLTRINYILKQEPHTLLAQAAIQDFKYDYFPNLPAHCGRGSYVLDSHKESLYQFCTKLKKRHGTLMPGVFTIHCTHGICLGYTIMQNAESANVPFTIFRTRFHVAPDVIIFDNACNLQEYCLNRDPGFFKNTKFLVDRLHWFNHVNCNEGFKMDTYSQFNYINSQVAEQSNASLNKLKSMLSYCNQENFNSQLRLYLWFRNTLHSLQLRDPSNSIEEILKVLLPHFTKR